MQPRFKLGKVTAKDEAAYALSLSGQDASFFLDRHQSGDWGAATPEQNEKGLREGLFVLSQYRTLRGHEILVITFFSEQETHVFCPPNGVSKHVGLYWLAEWGPMQEPPRPKPEEPDVKQPHGNGSGGVEISQSDMGGWVRVYPSRMIDLPQDLPLYLSHTLAEWFRHRPNLRMRCIVPVQRDGNTVELHAWFDAHLFPATALAPTPKGHPQG
jgi:hypothetical protein